MKIPHYTIIDEHGTPQSVIISWADFQEIQKKLNSNTLQNSAVVPPPALDSTPLPPSAEDHEAAPLAEKTADFVEGGAFKKLSELGITLPGAITKKVIDDTPKEEILKTQIEGAEIKIGKRIR